MADYKVLKVSSQEPKTYDGPNGTVFYIKCMLDGHDKPVSIGKKSPNAIKEGDTVSGEITATQYETDKFTAEKKAFTPGFTKEPRDNDRIVAQWAIGQATTFVLAYNQSTMPAEHLIEEWANKYYAMVERVKNPQGLKADGGLREPSGLEKARAQAQAIKQKTSEPVEVPESNDDVNSMVAAGIDDYGDEPINLDDIPF